MERLCESDSSLGRVRTGKKRLTTGEGKIRDFRWDVCSRVSSGCMRHARPTSWFTLLVGCQHCWAGESSLTPLPLVPARIASRATLPLSRSRAWRLETTISSSRRRCFSLKIFEMSFVQNRGGTKYKNSSFVAGKSWLPFKSVINLLNKFLLLLFRNCCRLLFYLVFLSYALIYYVRNMILVKVVALTRKINFMR